MARQFIRPVSQIKTIDTFDDQVAAGSALETTSWNMEQMLGGIISQLNRFLNTSVSGNDWFADLTAPTTFENGAQRGIDDVNQDLHDLERKRVLVSVRSLTDVTVTALQNWEILVSPELPSNTTAAVGAVTTRGTVAAFHPGTFGTHSLAEVAGTTAISPKNLCKIVDAATNDPILSSGREVWALFQTEIATDGHTMNYVDQRAQLSFVRITASSDDLEACPVADIAGKTIHFASIERKALEDLNEQDFLKGAEVDVPSASTVTRQVAYDNQGTTPVDVTTHSYLDLEGAGLKWEIRDDNEAVLFNVTENSLAGTSTIAFGADVDVFDNNAASNDFLQGAAFDTGGTTINVGVTPGQIDSAGALVVASAAAGDLTLSASDELILSDGFYAGSTYDTPFTLSDSSAEWSAFEAAYGEVSLLNAIVQAGKSDNRRRAVATVSTAITSGTLIEGPGGPGSANISADLLDYRYVTSFDDDVEVFINGVLQFNGSGNDVYGSAVAAEQQYGCFYATYTLKASPGNPDVIQMFISGHETA